MTCNYLVNNCCQVVYSIAGVHCTPTEEQCNFCTNNTSEPQSINVVTVSLAVKHSKNPSKVIKDYGEVIQEKHDGTYPGTELKKLISWFVWSKKAKECPICKDREQTMNQWGVEKCKRNINIILGWLKESAKEHGYPYSERIARAFVNKALKNCKPVTLPPIPQSDRSSQKLQHVISWDEFTEDILTLSQIILERHPDVSGIAGVPRSGMRVACDISIRLGVPLYEANHTEGLRYIGGGGRIRLSDIHGERVDHNGPIVLVDDSTCSGWAIAELEEHESLKSLPKYVVYAATPGIEKVDGYAKHWELPHLFDWNLLNNGLILTGSNVGIDFDGVLCPDCSVEDDDDGYRYINWLRTVKPIRTPRDYKVPFIITARREAYREITEHWLARHRMQYGKLIMFPGTFEDRMKTCIGTWKADMCDANDVGIFIESSYHQASIIANKRNKITISLEKKP